MANCKGVLSSTRPCVGLLFYPNEYLTLLGLLVCSDDTCVAASCVSSCPLHLRDSWISAHLNPEPNRLEASTLALAPLCLAPASSCSFSPSSPYITQRLLVVYPHFSILNSMDQNDLNVIGHHFQQCHPTIIDLNDDQAIVSYRYGLWIWILDSVPCFSSHLGCWLQPVHYFASKVFSKIIIRAFISLYLSRMVEVFLASSF